MGGLTLWAVVGVVGLGAVVSQTGGQRGGQTGGQQPGKAPTAPAAQPAGQPAKGPAGGQPGGKQPGGDGMVAPPPLDPSRVPAPNPPPAVPAGELRMTVNVPVVEEPLAQALLRRSTSEETPEMAVTPRSVTAAGASLASLVEAATGLPASAISIESTRAAGERFTARFSTRTGDPRRMLWVAIEETLEVRLVSEKVKVEVVVLKARRGETPGLAASPAGQRFAKRSSDTVLSGRAMPMGQVTAMLGERLGVSVIDETGLTGLRDWAVNLPADADRDAVLVAVAEQLRLEVQPGTREQVRVRVVDRAAK